MYGISGSSRSGKSTLAKALAQTLNLPYVDSSTTALMKQSGYNPVANMSIADRIDAQEKLLISYVLLMQKAPRVFITDRTPIDMLAYTLAEVTMHNTNAEISQRINLYAERCMNATGNLFSLLFVTRPLPFYEVAPDKPPPNSAYQSHIHLLIEGAVHACSVPWMIVSTDTVENRVKQVVGSIGDYMIKSRDNNPLQVFH